MIYKLPNTNNKSYREAVRRYLAYATDIEGQEEATVEERIAHMVERFEAEQGWDIPRSGEQGAALNWLQGLAINVEYLNHKIPAAVLKLHGMEGETMTEELEEKVVDMWWGHLAFHLVRIRREHMEKAAKA